METGLMAGEILYKVPNMVFTEFRLSTDAYNGPDDNIYITTSIKGYVAQEFTQPFF